MRWRKPLLKTVSDHVNTEEAAIRTCNIYNVYCEEVNAIRRHFIDFTKYETLEMGPTVPEAGARRPTYNATVSH
jgi:hypothetical protein